MAVNGIENGVADVTVNGNNYAVEIAGGAGSDAGNAFAALRPHRSGPPSDVAEVERVFTASIQNACDPSRRAVARRDGTVSGTTTGATSRPVSNSVPGDSAPDTAAAEKRRIISSPLPGVVLELYVMPGQAVKRGDRLAVIEAMKMENDILAECDGTVSEIYVTKGSPVDEGARLMLIS